ncbi:MAG: hypothetical protein CO108_08610 [Deltaproteobacteria bacterium CG_4_9_14_3_um_filter_63_12]|nr:MAG: hypothetical protein COW42_07155 [Deltaproteobacteria bacterium CG17_big_fil_post_rev_8_21_14_2_50_63_7]PJB44467.1 MAG: hypothetical protein CO108_08610 [Deltaproteobacteria bacterium CG_4_9_14_3_um_filter_63_12]
MDVMGSFGTSARWLLVAVLAMSCSTAQPDGLDEVNEQVANGRRGDRATTSIARVQSVFPEIPSWQHAVVEQTRPFPFLAGEDPNSSVSVGTTSDGTLINGRWIAPSPTVEILPLQFTRDLAYGTDELVAALRSAAAHVAEKTPGSILYLGNVAQRWGGDIQWSVSHNNGRDADLAFYSRDPFGWQRRPPNLLHYGQNLRSVEFSGFYRFDAALNADLAQGLFNHTGSQIQYMFMARYLELAVVDVLRQRGVEREELIKIQEVLYEPRGSAIHDDHLHIRIYCTADDLCGGCENTGSIRPWVDEFASAKAACVERFADIVQDDVDPVQRAHAVSRLGLVGATAKRSVVIAAASDSDPGVRLAAVAVLGQLRDSESTRALIAREPLEADAAVKCALVDALGGTRGRPTADHLGAMLAREDGTMCGAGLPLKAKVAQAATNLESTGIVPALIAVLDDVQIGAAAAEALQMLTNHQEAIDWSQPTAGTDAKTQWEAWYKRNKKKTREVWLAAGFREVGYSVASLQKQSVPGLLDAILGPKHCSVNAQRALMKISGEDPASLDWSPEDAAWYWTRFFKKNQSKYGLDLSHRPERPVSATPSDAPEPDSQ